MFKFRSSQTESAIKKNETLAKALKEGVNFAFKVRLFTVVHLGQEDSYIMYSTGHSSKTSVTGSLRCQSFRRASI